MKWSFRHYNRGEGSFVEAEVRADTGERGPSYFLSDINVHTSDRLNVTFTVTDPWL
jgi:hypothetical protein